MLIMSDNTVVVNAINAKTVHGRAIYPLIAALYDIEISSNWLSSEDNWIADALSRFELHKIVNIFPQFQTATSSLCRDTGKPMSVLRENPSMARTRCQYSASLPCLSSNIRQVRSH